jgi:preprotein translocase subunit SecG
MMMMIIIIIIIIIQTGSGAHPASYPMGTRGSFPEVKRPGREADHSPHLVPRSKNEWSYTSVPPIRLPGMVLSKITGTLPIIIIIIIIIIRIIIIRYQT